MKKRKSWFQIMIFHLTTRKKLFIKHKVYWYKCIPFVVAEAWNHEWEMMPEDLKKELSSLRSMYNTNGNWYILEPAWFFYLGFGGDNFCFYDSMHMEHNGMSEEQRWMSMVTRAEEDINELWSNLWKKATAK